MFQEIILYVVSSSPVISGIRTHNFSGDIGTDCIGSSKFNDHTITTTTIDVQRSLFDYKKYIQILHWVKQKTNVDLI
jgi:hypothetical protein